MKKNFNLFLGLIGIALALAGAARPAKAASPVVVTPADMNGWFFFQETPTGSGTFTYGPSAPPLGGGSAQLTVNSTGGEIFGTFAYVGTRLDAITSLAYGTYRTSGSGALAPSLQFDIDTNVTDTNTAWQGRLVYEPYYTHAVSTGTWQTWDPLDNAGTGNWWFTGAPGNAKCTIGNPCTWSEVLADFPNAGVRSAGANTGTVQFKAGGGWTSGFVGSVDAFSIGVSNAVTTYDFELPYTVPTVTTISPATKLTTDAGFTITVNGANFFPASVVQWNGSNRVTTYASSTQLTALIPSSDLATAATLPVTVVTPAPGGGASNAMAFTVQGLTPPVGPAPTGGGVHTGTITVVKTVINDNGDNKAYSDFPLFVNGIPVASGISNDFPAPAGVYAVTETNAANYKHTFSGDCDATGRLNLNPGDVKFCILINDDIGAPILVPPVPPLIDVVKVPSPLALPGGPGPVSYTYTLRNIGTVPVTNIAMVGDSCSPITLLSGDTNADAKLDVDETWVYRCATTLSQTHTNTVVATGWANGLIASDIATATVVVGAPGLPNTGVVVPPLIHVTKIPSPLTLTSGGGAVTYTEKITNPGAVPLSNIHLTDDTCSPMQYVSGDTNGDGRLDTNETWTHTCRTNIIKTTANTAVASGEANGLAVKDYAIAIVVVADVVPRLPDTGFVPYRAADALASASTINADKNLEAPSSSVPIMCAADARMKLADDGDPSTQSDSVIFFCGADGRRYPFPNAGTYASWYKDFSGVQIVSASAIAAIPLGSNVTYRPGSRLLKIQSDPKVYAVAKGGVLRWIADETVARALYGSNWTRMISDVSDTLLKNGYVIGEPITAAEDVSVLAPSGLACTTDATFISSPASGKVVAQITAIQKLLQCLGDFPKTIAPTGFFGPITQSALKAFELKQGLAPVGAMSASTIEALNQYLAK